MFRIQSRHSRLALAVFFQFAYVSVVYAAGTTDYGTPDHVPSGDYEELNIWNEFRLGASAYVNRPRFEQAAVNYVYSPQSTNQDSLELFRALATNGDVAVAEVSSAGKYHVPSLETELNWTIDIRPFGGSAPPVDSANELSQVLDRYKSFTDSTTVLEPSHSSLSEVFEQWDRFAGWYASAYGLSALEPDPVAEPNAVSDRIDVEEFVGSYHQILQEKGPHELLRSYYQNANLNRSVCEDNKWILRSVDATHEGSTYKDFARICDTSARTLDSVVDRTRFVVRPGEGLEEWSRFVNWINEAGVDLDWSVAWPYASYALISTVNSVQDLRGEPVIQWDVPLDDDGPDEDEE